MLIILFLAGLLAIGVLGWTASYGNAHSRSLALLASLSQCVIAVFLLVFTVPRLPVETELFLPQFSPALNLFVFEPLLLWLWICLIPLIYVFAIPRRSFLFRNVITLASLMAALGAGFTSGRSVTFPYYHQISLMSAGAAGVGFIGNLLIERGDAKLVKWFDITLLTFAPLIGFASWSLVNVAIVSFKVSHETHRNEYCLLGYECGKDYYPIKNLWGLRGSNLYTPYCSGGSHEYQFGFSALLVMPSKTMNWSYQAQRFENMLEGPQISMHLPTNCPSEKQ